MTSTDERNWTQPSQERKMELFDHYREQGHFGVMEQRYTTPETVAVAKAHDWPGAYRETAPADEYRTWCLCGAEGEIATDWREAREWIRRHREQEYGLERQEFIPTDPHVAPHLRDHVVFLDLDVVARRQGEGGWLAFCDCETLTPSHYFDTYEDAYEAAVNHAAEHGGRWGHNGPGAPEDYERES